MKLAIIGYGKMGRLIEQLAPEFGFTVHACIDMGDDFAKAQGADAAIEFTTPDAAPAQPAEPAQAAPSAPPATMQPPASSTVTQ